MFALHSTFVINMKSLSLSFTVGMYIGHFISGRNSFTDQFDSSLFFKNAMRIVISASSILAVPITNWYMLATSVLMNFIFFI